MHTSHFVRLSNIIHCILIFKNKFSEKSRYLVLPQLEYFLYQRLEITCFFKNDQKLFSVKTFKLKTRSEQK